MHDWPRHGRNNVKSNCTSWEYTTDSWSHLHLATMFMINIVGCTINEKTYNENNMDVDVDAHYIPTIYIYILESPCQVGDPKNDARC